MKRKSKRFVLKDKRNMPTKTKYKVVSWVLFLSRPIPSSHTTIMEKLCWYRILGEWTNTFNLYPSKNFTQFLCLSVLCYPRFAKYWCFWHPTAEKIRYYIRLFKHFRKTFIYVCSNVEKYYRLHQDLLNLTYSNYVKQQLQKTP